MVINLPAGLEMLQSSFFSCMDCSTHSLQVQMDAQTLALIYCGGSPNIFHSELLLLSKKIFWTIAADMSKILRWISIMENISRILRWISIRAGKVNWQVQVWRASLTDLTNLSSKTFYPPPTVWQASYTYYSATFILLLQVSSEVQLGNQFKLAGKVPCWLKSRSRPRFDDLTMPIAGWMIHNLWHK